MKTTKPTIKKSYQIRRVLRRLPLGSAVSYQLTSGPRAICTLAVADVPEVRAQIRKMRRGK